MGKNLANFEGLIRGAIAAKQALTPEARSEVYQSSRNALSRLIEGNRTLTVESAMQEQSALEEAILRIESEFVRFAPVEPSQPLPESEPIPTYESASGVESDVPIGSGSEFTSTSPMEPGGTTAEPSIGSPGSHVADRMAVNIDEDPLAELKEILLEDSDDALRESLDPSGFQSSSIAQSGTDDEIAMRTEPVGTASVDEPPAQHPEPTLLDSDPAVQVHADDPNSSAVAPEAPQLEGQAEMADAVTGDKPVTEPSAYDDKENMPLEFARRR